MCLGLLALAAAGPSRAASETSPPPDYSPPNTQGLCPGLVEDYDLCSDDPWSGNCADFVAAADRIGEIYRSEVRAHPGWASELEATIWWGCGSADLAALRSLLQRIDTPRARAVLARAPYRESSEPVAPPSPPPPGAAPDCEAPATEAERVACAARHLARARSDHTRAFDACKGRVAPGLRGELVEDEESWKQMLPMECAGSDRTRDECLARAYEERTESLLAMHPECAADGSG